MIPRGRFHVSLADLFKALISLGISSMEKEDKVLAANKLFNDKFGFDKSYFLSSCRISFLSVLEGLELGNGDTEVIMTPITIPDMVNSVRIAGYKPIFADIDEATHALDLNSLKSKKTNKTKIVLLTYLSGYIPNIELIKKYCEEESLILIEDFSQLIGGSYQGKALGTYGDYAVASFSIGKTVTSQVGGVLVINSTYKEKEIISRVKKNSSETAKKSFFLSQLKENLKIEFLTSPLCFDFFTGPALKVLAKFFPDKYLGVHKAGVVNRFDEEDLFFDDIPVKRKAFQRELFFKFNDYMSELLIRSIREWDERKSKRKDNLNFVLNELGHCQPSYLAGGLFQEDIFPIRIGVNCKDTGAIQLKLMESGFDTGTYGLNLCHKEEVFREYLTDLPVAERVHKNCIFISLHEKVKKTELARALRVLQEVLLES